MTVTSVHVPADSGSGRDGRESKPPQILCRAVNEQIRRVSGSFDFPSEIDLVCECTRPGCLKVVRVSPGAYENVRGFPTRFLIKAGHVDHENERVVEEAGRFVVVEKFGPEAEAAIRDDPRRHGSPHRVPEPRPAA